MKPRISPWQQVIRLGEQLLETDSLASQRDIILEAVKSFGGKARFWLDESLFRLPGRNQNPLFPIRPPTKEMRRALATGEFCCPVEGSSCLALPLKHRGVVLGVFQVERVAARPFRKSEIESLEGMAGHIALSLAASHRLTVEQWRIEQLTLVRRVSAQIANVADLDDLTRRITRLIQKTFSYYYVAVFTLEPGQEQLTFRSSAGQARGPGRKRKSLPLQVRAGEGLIGLAAQTGQESVVNDINAEPRFRYIAALPETRSEVALPLKIEDRILGVLDIQSNQQNAFHPNDLLVLRALADNIATAVEGTRLYSDLDRRARQLEIAAEVSDNIASILDLDELLGKVAVLLNERLGYPFVHLYTVHPNRRQIIYEAGSGAYSVEEKGQRLDLDSAEGIIPWVARNSQTLLANDVSQEPRYRPPLSQPDNTCAEIAVPLTFDNHVVGVLDVQSDKLNAFNADDRFLFETLADNIAVAIHNADLYRTERWRRQVADSLREVAGLISADASLDDVLDAILKELQRNLPCDVAAVWLLDGENLHLAHIHGADLYEVEMAMQRWPTAASYLAEALTATEPVIRKLTDPLGPTGMALGFSADYSSIAAALRVGDQPLGVLTLSHHTAGRYGHEAQSITATFASYAAVAIENARLYDSAQEQAYASAALLQVAQTAADASTLDEILGSVVRITPLLVGVGGCAVYLKDGDHFHPAQSYGFPDDATALLMGEDFEPGEFPLLDAVCENGRMVVGLIDPSIPEDWLDPEQALTAEETLYAFQTYDRLLIGLPLMIKGDIYGVMLVLETSEARRFRQKRVEIIVSIAQQVALSIQNDHFQREMVTRERLEREIEVARQIQRTLLPDHLPEIPGWDLAAMWKTARQVGGDFYDVFILPDRRLGLFIADVSDKGIPAALFMALTRTLVRAVVYDTTSPAEALRRVNDLMIPDNQQAMFVTGVYGVLSLDSGEFRYANAGHNPPLVACRADGQVEALHRTGPALGIIEDYSIDERTVKLEPGNCLLLYTDGLTEAFSVQDELYGEERLSHLIEDAVVDSIKDMLDAIETSVTEFINPLPLADDMTMLAVRRMP
jgi:sigma-B regulation protein RsbU (phosphoserine phosphatase)